MKSNYIKFVLPVFLVTLLLCGCAASNPDLHLEQEQTKMTNHTTESSDELLHSLNFDARYIVSDGGDGDVLRPEVYVIFDETQLSDYISSTSKVFDMTSCYESIMDETSSFTELCVSYDERFFSDNYLILIRCVESSSSNKLVISDVKLDSKEKMTISVNRIVPEAFVDAQGYWHLILELDKSERADLEQEIHVEISDTSLS